MDILKSDTTANSVRMNTLNRVIGILDKVTIPSRWSNTIGIGALFLMICLTFLDVIMRYIFNQPFKITTDLTGVMMLIAIFFAMAYSYNEKAHVALDIVTGRLSGKVRLIWETIFTFLSIVVFVILIWVSFKELLWFAEIGQTKSSYMLIPAAPLVGVIVFGCVLTLLLLLRDFLININKALELHLRGFQWLLMLGIPVLTVVLSAIWMQPALWPLGNESVAAIGLVFLLLILFTGMPIAFGMIGASLVMLGKLVGADSALRIVGTELYQVNTSYSWAVTLFFVLISYFCLVAKFGDDLYFAAHKWFGRMRGGLAVATIVASAAMAAIVGEGIAALATMGTIALPEMKKYRYNAMLASGSILAGATLGPIIPPSLTFIFYAILTRMSIGKLFIAGIIPGLLITVIFIITVSIWCRLKPDAGPAGPSSTFSEKLNSSKGLGPVLILFVVVIGGIYAGIFTPAEGGGIGCVIAIILTFLYRRFSWKSFNFALLESGKIIAMSMLMLTGAILFSRFAAFCNLGGAFEQLLVGLSLPASAILWIILIIFFFLGFIMDILPLVFIGVPIVHPIAVGLGADPIWFAVMLSIIIGVGMITPPVGIYCFILKGLSKDTSLESIYGGAIPFSIATLVSVVILFYVPEIITWLPNLLY